MSREFRFVDLFCGGGGSITGAVNALRAAGIRYEGRGFNHWETAIRTIRANHPEIVPDFNRACAPIESVFPDEIYQDDPTRIDVIWASPSCTQHSRASGGKKPKSNQLRCQPECLLPYLRLTKCRRMFVENVRELLKWGPVLDQDILYKGKKYRAGQPDPRKEGTFFNLWYREVKASGYAVDMQVLNAANYGAVTSRERLIIQAVRKSSGEKICWPEPTHLEEPGLFAARYKPWRAAAEIIDWSIPGESIFNRKKPLCLNTLRRIEAGIRKYWGAWAEPFLIVLRGTGDGQIQNTAIPLSQPLPTITAGGSHIALVQPLWMDIAHTRTEGVSGTVESPLNTITCSHGTHAVITPCIVRYNEGGNRVHGIASPPVPTIDCSNRYSVIRPLIIPQQSCGTAKSTDAPLSTITTGGAIGMVQPFVVKYYGTEHGAESVDAPLDTITTHDRFGLVQGRILTLPDGQQYKLDIMYRMLTARELADATTFPHDYRFIGGDTAAKKQIGNAVPPVLAEALYRAAISA